MRVRCPHCNAPVEVLDDDPLVPADCPSCGNSVSPLGAVETTDGELPADPSRPSSTTDTRAEDTDDPQRGEAPHACQRPDRSSADGGDFGLRRHTVLLARHRRPPQGT